MNSKKLLDWLYPRRCAFCDEVLGNREKYLCHSCRRRMPKPIGEPNCKKCGKPLLFLGRLMGLYGADFIRQVHPQVIFPVPIHRKKKSVRGYNQAEVLAREISRGFSIPLRTDLVLRKKSTKAQKELSRKERKKNMERAFVVKKEAGMYRDILLVDDIYTTGSTANAIAGKLKAVGVKNVYVLTLCIGKGI